jgi:hypothetical protein
VYVVVVLQVTIHVGCHGGVIGDGVHGFGHGHVGTGWGGGVFDRPQCGQYPQLGHVLGVVMVISVAVLVMHVCS